MGIGHPERLRALVAIGDPLVPTVGATHQKRVFAQRFKDGDTRLVVEGSAALRLLAGQAEATHLEVLASNPTHRLISRHNLGASRG